MATPPSPKTSGRKASKASKRKASKAQGFDYDQFLQAELTKFVGKGGPPSGGRVGPPIGLPTVVPLAQYGEHLKGAATAVKASHLQSPSSDFAAARANAGPQPAPSVGAPQWPGQTTQWPGHLANYHTEDLGNVATARKSSSNAAEEAEAAVTREEQAEDELKAKQEDKSRAMLAGVKAKQEAELLALEEALARAEEEEMRGKQNPAAEATKLKEAIPIPTVKRVDGMPGEGSSSEVRSIFLECIRDVGTCSGWKELHPDSLANTSWSFFSSAEMGALRAQLPQAIFVHSVNIM